MTETISKRTCASCIGESFLKQKIAQQELEGTCSYCKEKGHVVGIEWISAQVKRALEEHYLHTSTEPDGVPMELIKEFGWERSGDPVELIISEMLHVDEEPLAVDVREDLENRFGDFGLAQIGEEDCFDPEAQYARKHVDDSEHLEKWYELEKTLKTESRFFNAIAQEVLTEIFDDFESMKSRFGFPIIQMGGPKRVFSNLFRGRVLRRDNIKKILAEPERHLGPPPSSVASDGRMNPHGVSVFYGASTPETVLAEVRPPVGAKVAIAKFSLLQDITLLNIRGFQDIHIEGSMFDPEYGRKLRQAAFLRRLANLLTQPVLPSDARSEYLVTQAVAEFLSKRVDGLVYPSTQTDDEGFNIVLFRKSASVWQREKPKGTVTAVECVMQTSDGFEPDYMVIDKLPEKSDSIKPIKQIANESAKPFLKMDEKTFRIHHVEAVSLRTDSFAVRRHEEHQGEEERF